MNLFDKLKQLKLIEPDQAFSERSRREVLSVQPAIFPFRRMSPWQIFVRVIETGVAAGLAALFIFIMTGGVATSPLTPVPFSAVNPDALHAEAQAIDMQIKLTNLAYDASVSTAITTGSPAVAMFAMTAKIMGDAATNTATSTTASSSLSVDEALKALSQ